MGIYSKRGLITLLYSLWVILLNVTASSAVPFSRTSVKLLSDSLAVVSDIGFTETTIGCAEVSEALPVLCLRSSGV